MVAICCHAGSAVPGVRQAGADPNQTLAPWKSSDSRCTMEVHGSPQFWYRITGFGRMPLVSLIDDRSSGTPWRGQPPFHPHPHGPRVERAWCAHHGYWLTSCHELGYGKSMKISDVDIFGMLIYVDHVELRPIMTHQYLLEKIQISNIPVPRLDKMLAVMAEGFKPLLTISAKRPQPGRVWDPHSNIYPLVNKHSYWKWPFTVDLPIKNGDFP